MAGRSFLKNSEMEEARARLIPPRSPPSGKLSESVWSDIIPKAPLNIWLGDLLYEKMSSHSDWTAARPIIVGSWQRQELCPKSDIDILFTGDERAIKSLVQDFLKNGIKLRARTPKDAGDWFAGVEVFDQLALLSAKVAEPSVLKEYQSQRSEFLKKNPKFRQTVLRAIAIERRERTERHDGIANYLEPNIKYGRGGLRDINQALVLAGLFAEKIDSDSHAIQVMQYYLKFWLSLRNWLHLRDGGGDILLATAQAEASLWLGYREPRDFNREIQKGLSRVSFYWQWIVDRAQSSQLKINQVESRPIKKPAEFAQSLKADASFLMQNRVRIELPQAWKTFELSGSFWKARGRELRDFISVRGELVHLKAMFQSRWIDFVVPEHKRIVGYVQHDQYHRFTVDAHLLQALIVLKNTYQKPKQAFALKNTILSLSDRDWEVLSWTCLYHDLAKGRSGDHSLQGSDIVAQDFKRFGFPPSLSTEVSWMVEKHLIFSQAAFRMNPSAATTWKYLRAQGATEKRALLLAVFTAIDIIATNPEAWNSWKADLLAKLLENYLNPVALPVVELVQALEALKWPVDSEAWIEKLDRYFLEQVLPSKVLKAALLKDLNHCRIGRAASAPIIFQSSTDKKRKSFWVRFHHSKDSPGLFLNFVQALTSAGFSILHAAVLTDDIIGVYDWFEVKDSKLATLGEKKVIQMLALREGANFADIKSSDIKYRFSQVTVDVSSSTEWIVTFRGVDRPGALLAAAQSLKVCACNIKWARVHTWGRQIDDVFGIDPLVFSESLSRENKPWAGASFHGSLTSKDLEKILEKLAVGVRET
jgi:[protein-PII] uridylyltransferase